MPPQNQRKSSSSEDLDEYLKFKQGQQAQQAMSLQQLGAMFNMSQQQVANEIARANLELSRSNQGIAQGRLDLDIASNPSMIQSRNAEAAYNQARADGYGEDLASQIAARAATTAQTKALTAGQGITNEMAQRVSNNQDLALEQQNRAGEASIALTNAQSRGSTASARNLEEQYPYLAEKYRIENQLGQTQADTAAYNLDYVLPENLRNIKLQGDTAVQLFGRNPTEWMMKDALTNAQIAATSAGADAQVRLNNDFQRRVDQDAAAARVQLQLAGGSIATQGYDNLERDLKIKYMPKMFEGQQNLNAAQIQSLFAGSAFNLFDRGGLTLQQMQERALTPESMAPIKAKYAATAAANKAVIDADEERQRQAEEAARLSAGMFNINDIPADLQPKYAAEIAKQDAFYAAQKIETDRINAIKKRNAIEQRLNRMQFADSPDFGSSSY